MDTLAVAFYAVMAVGIGSVVAGVLLFIRNGSQL